MFYLLLYAWLHELYAEVCTFVLHTLFKKSRPWKKEVNQLHSDKDNECSQVVRCINLERESEG